MVELLPVIAADVRFTVVVLDHPLTIAGAVIDRLTMAQVDVRVRDSSDRSTSGRGASMLSVPWAWPGALPFEERDRRMRDLVESSAKWVVGAPAADPFAAWSALVDHVRTLPEAEGMPPAAVLLCVAAVDSALHDASAAAQGLSAIALAARHDWARRDPRAFSAEHHRIRVPVQHVVGLADGIGDDDELGHRIRDHGIRHLKVKLVGDGAGDAARVMAIHERFGGFGLSLALDANEGYPHPEGFHALLGALQDREEIWTRIRYIEQPVPRAVRDLRPWHPPRTSAERLPPFVLDEGHVEIHQLSLARDQGWSGVAVKATKGQSFAILTFLLARACGLFTVLQDLTAVDLALEHSASLASALPFAYRAFECNSIQYAPRANRRLAERRPDLVRFHDDGTAAVGPCPQRGLYSGAGLRSSNPHEEE